MKKKLFLLGVFILGLTVGALAQVSRVEDRPLIIATSIDTIPFHFKDAAGQPAGIAVEKWKLWSKKTGTPIQFKFGTWQETLNWMKNGTADIHAGLFYSKKRDGFLDYSSALGKMETHLFSHNTISHIKTIDELSAYKIGVVSGDLAENYLKKNLPDALVVGFKDHRHLIRAAQVGQIKVFVADTATALFLLKEKRATLQFQYSIDKPLYTNEFLAAVPNGKRELVEKIKKGMKQISHQENIAITRRWISIKPPRSKAEMVIAIHHNYPPLTFLNSEGQPAGLLVDIWKLWAEKTETPIRFRSSHWQGTLEAVQSGEADIHSGLFHNQSRSEWMSFSDPLYDVGTRLFYSENLKQIPTLQNLNGKNVGTMGGSYQESWLKEHYPKIHTVVTQDEESLIKLAKSQKVAAYIAEEPSMEFLLNKLGMQGKITQNGKTIFQNKVFAGVKKSNQALVLKINQGLEKITLEELIKIEKSWIPNSQSQIFKKRKGSYQLTPKEQRWLKEHPVIRIAPDPNLPPFEFFDQNGVYNGIAADYISLIEKKLNIRFQPAQNKTWNDGLEQVKERTLDLLPFIMKNAEREKHLHFTKPYLQFPLVLITSRENSTIRNLENVRTKKLSVVDGYYTQYIIGKHHPEIELIAKKSVSDALLSVTSGETDAFFGSLATASYYIEQLNLPTLKVAGATKYTMDLSIGVRKDWPVLQSILNKTLASISQNERVAISKKWIALEYTDPSLGDTSQVQGVVNQLAVDLIYLFAGLAVVALFLYFAIQRWFGDRLVKLFQSNQINGLAFLVIAGFLVALIILGQVGLNGVKLKMKRDIGTSLQTTLQSTNRSLSILIEALNSNIRTLASNPVLRRAVLKHLKTERDGETLRRSQGLKQIREIFSGYKDKRRVKDFFIIAPDFTNIASMESEGVGEVHRLQEQQGERLKRAFRGETIMVPPFPDDSIKASNEGGVQYPSLFFITPLRNISGEIKAVLALEYALDSDISKMIQEGHIGKSGKTYLFNTSGELLSPSRFREELIALRLIRANQSEVLNLKIRDPGVNLAQEQKGAVPVEQRELTLMAKEALQGTNRVDIEGYRDYRGVRVLGAWLWNEKFGFGIATEMNEAEILSGYYATRNIVFVILGFSIFLAIFLTTVSLWLGRKANKALMKSKEELEEKVEERTKELSVEVKERQKSESLFKCLLEAAPDAMIIINEKADIILVNAQTEKVFGYSRDELIGEKIEVLIPERFRKDHPKKRDGFIAEARTRPLTAELELVGQHKSGTEFPVEVGLSPMKALDDIMIFATVRDITERKKAEMNLMEAEERSRLLLESVGEGIVGVDREGHAMFINPAGHEMLGFEADEILGNKIHSIFHHTRPDGSEYPVETCPMYKSYTEGTVHHVDEEVLWKKDGHPFPVDYTATPIIRKGEISGAVITFKDITERKLAEEELLKLSRAVEYSPVTVVMTDLVGNIIYVNPMFTKTTGYTSEEAIGNNPRVLKSGHMPPEVYKALWDTITNGKVWTGELENRKKNGETYWESASISPILNASGDVTHYVAIKEDITLKKQMQDELKSAKEMAEAATKAKGEFLANMSHEIRTPMNAIIGINHLLSKTTLDRKQQDYVDKVYYSAKNLLGIINDILDFSKIEAGKLQMETIDFELNDVMENLSSIVSVKAQDKGLELIINVGTSIPRFLIGDPLRLGQILINLANNAVKFTGEGEIVISVSLVEMVNDQVILQFSVRDTGIGLTREQQGRLFQSFSQADTSTTRKFGGTGLGLSISKYLVEQMDGKIWIESCPGQGSDFLFTAKFDVQAEQKVRPKVIPEKFQNAHILIADDNQTARDVLTDYLEDFGFMISTVTNGKEAVQFITEKNAEVASGKNIELILMDWQMPKLDGLEAAKMIKSEINIAKIPKIVMITAYGREEVFLQVEDLNLDGMLVKPITQSILYDAIMGAFGQEVTQPKSKSREELSIPDGFEEIRGANILLVEDNEINQQVASELLEAEGMRVHIVDDGQKAVNFMADKEKSSDINIILMDLQMPIMGGYKATELIRETIDIESLPIIAMTADAMTGVKENVIKVGMNGYVSKPINPMDLFKTLVQWIKPEDIQPCETAMLESPNAQTEDTQHIFLPGSTEWKEKKGEPGVECDENCINVNEGLARVNQNKKLYLSLLKKFRMNNKSILSEILEAVEKDDLSTAERLAHTLKGVAGNLGAGELFQVSKVLDNILKIEGYDKGDFQKTMANTEMALLKVMQLIDTILKVNAPQQTAADDQVNLEAVQLIIETLKEQLEGYDSEAAHNFEKLKQALGTKAVEFDLDPLEHLIEQYDFEGAIDVLNKFKLS